ncbi:DNA translocase FtsK 4TM domain-containing protein [Candidatus Saccharibacteria bacterium]|nr:DNA translocase FtsK 4TM domain-containing protein [Candidatus Saccharibacteria bacterium]
MANTKKKSSRGGRSSGRGGSRGGSASKRSTREVRKKQELPGGWGQQVLALILIAISVILIATWFSGEKNQAYKIVFSVIGNGMYVLPFLFTYLAVKIFRSEDNRLPVIVWVVSLLLIAFASGASGVSTYGDKGAHGGAIGEWINELVIPMFGNGTAIFVYVVLIAVCLLFILQKTPSAVVKGLRGSLKGKEKEAMAEVRDDEIEEVEDGKKHRLEFRVNKGVAVEEKKEEEAPQVKKRGLFGRGKIEEVEKPANKEVKAEKPAGALTSIADKDWKFPPIDLLEKKQSPADAGNIQQNAVVIKSTLAEFGIDVEMEGANIGPRVTQYTMRPPAGVNLSKILARDKELALNLAVDKIRIEAPIPGTRSVGVEIPNVKSASVMMRGIIDSREWKNAKDPLTFAVGKDISGKSVVANLAKMPHLLIAGTTGSGKSVMTNTLISSLLYRNSPSDLKLIIVDPKQVEMALYDGIPHLLTPIITSTEKALSALKWAVNEMEKRYTLMAEKKVKNISDYNARIEGDENEIRVEDGEIKEVEEKPQEGKMPYIVIVIDEMADLMMMAGKDLEMLIVRIAQKGRAAGIHLVLATQRPEVKVITGLIKANVPGRIAFAVGSQIDSRIMLDQGGAEKLLGKGDMLMLTTEMMGKPRRIQGAWAYEDDRGNGDVKNLTDYLKKQRPPEYNPEVIAQPVQIKGMGPTDGGSFGDLGRKYDPNDPVVRKAVEISISKGKFSTAMLQTYLGKGHGFVSGLAIWFEEIGVIGPQNGNKPRDMLIKSLEEFDQLTSN